MRTWAECLLGVDRESSSGASHTIEGGGERVQVRCWPSLFIMAS